MNIRPATAQDWPSIWAVIEPVIRAGETYTIDRELTEEQAKAYWTGVDKECFVADEDGVVLGTFYLRANQTGGGGHVSNCGYITGAAARGKGVAKAMCLHSLEQAREKGFRAMQFNFVVSTNEGAVRLWKSLGFAVVGTLPKAFAHPALGYVDAFVMFRDLS